MSGMQRHRISCGGAASADDAQNLSSAVQGMRWQGTDNRDRQLRALLNNGSGRSFLSRSVSQGVPFDRNLSPRSLYKRVGRMQRTFFANQRFKSVFLRVVHRAAPQHGGSTTLSVTDRRRRLGDDESTYTPSKPQSDSILQSKSFNQTVSGRRQKCIANLTRYRLGIGA
jgi:hypothetical protein